MKNDLLTWDTCEVEGLITTFYHVTLLKNLRDLSIGDSFDYATFNLETMELQLEDEKNNYTYSFFFELELL